MAESAAQANVHVLWARCDRYPRPQFVTAWNDGLVDAWHDWYLELRAKAIDEWISFGDIDTWTFWMTVEEVPHPAEVYEPIEIPPRERSGRV